MQASLHWPVGPWPVVATPKSSRTTRLVAPVKALLTADHALTLGEVPLPFLSYDDPALSAKKTSDLGWKSGADFSKDYAAKAVIGSGSFGKVRSAVHKSSGMEVAVKTMAKVRSRFTRERTLEKIRRESSFLQRLQVCPAVVRLIDRFETDSEVHIVTELCRGGDLRTLVESNGLMGEEALASVAFQALKFIHSCHDLGLLYGDLKPANFCLTDPVSLSDPFRMGVKAIDFGTSQNCGPAHRLSKWTGTLTFLSPEVFAQNYGHKADMWSLGVTLYWCFCRQYPFWEQPQPPAKARLEDMAEVVANAPISYGFGPWLHMSPEGLDFVQRCLTRDEAQRIGVADALQHPWFARYSSAVQGLQPC